ncbi:MAG: hypothetical protein IKE38_00135 [Erysipelotrichaceae bacterium]|nr:hypothetical protein [Erysipelotrichaceae bacterium]
MTKKDKAVQITIGVISALIALPSGMLIGIISYRTSSNLLVLYVFFLLSMAIAVMLQTAIHEAGHMVMGLLTGFRFLSYRVMSLILMKENGRLRLRRYSIPGTLGQCLMGTPVSRDKKPFFLYNAGGVIFNLISACICYPIAFRSMNAALAIIAAVNGMYALIMFFGNGIPYRGNGVANDGKNIQEMCRHPETVDSFYRMLDFNEMMADGARSRDIDETALDMRESTLCSGSIGASNIIYLENKLMDEHRFEEAEDLINESLAKEYPMTDVHLFMLQIDQKYIGMLRGEFEDFTDKKLLKYIEVAKTTAPSVVRYLYTKALYQNDAAEAEKQLRVFEALEKNHPYQGEYQGERELMAIAQEKFSSKDVEDA